MFWTADVEDNTPYVGGLYYRSDIKDFVQRVEEDGDKKIVGIKIDDTYNLEFIWKEVKKNPMSLMLTLEEKKNESYR